MRVACADCAIDHVLSAGGEGVMGRIGDFVIKVRLSAEPESDPHAMGHNDWRHHYDPLFFGLGVF